MVFDVVLFGLDLLTFYFMYAMLSLSLNLEFGYTGLPNFAKVLFYAGGAFVAGSLGARLGGWLLGISNAGPADFGVVSIVNGAFANNPVLALEYFLIIVVIAVAIGAALGFLVTFPALRLREDYLGITLIVSGELLRVFVRVYEPIIGGAHGTPLPDPFAWAEGYLFRIGTFIALLATSTLVLYVMCERIGFSPYGRMLRSIRDNEEAAQALGKDQLRAKRSVLMIGSAMAAYVGALYAFYTLYVNDAAFQPIVTFVVWLMVILGGAGNNRGVLAGALIYLFIDKVVDQVKQYIPLQISSSYFGYIILGVVLLVILLYRPNGLFPERPITNLLVRGKKRPPIEKKQT